MTPYIICYDIEKDKKRKKIADKLQEFGLERIQYSVFAGCLKAHLLVELKEWLEQILQTEEPQRDSVIILPITSQQLKKMTIFGNVSFDVDGLAGLTHTLFL